MSAAITYGAWSVIAAFAVLGGILFVSEHPGPFRLLVRAWDAWQWRRDEQRLARMLHAVDRAEDPPAERRRAA